MLYTKNIELVVRQHFNNPQLDCSCGLLFNET